MSPVRRNSLFAAVALVVLALLSVLYVSPVLTGKQLMQPDIVHYRGGAEELLQYRAEHGKETYWSDAMFGGMPTYQTGAQFRGDLIKQLDNAFNFLPRPANYLFLLFAGFFYLGMATVRNWKYALLGAVFFGLSTYFYIIIAAGHNGKVHTIAYFAPLLASVIMVFFRRQYFWGFVSTTIFMALQLVANHPQMTYYLFIALGFFLLSELLRAIFKTKDYKHFVTSTLVVGIAMAIGISLNSQRLMANAEYVKETVRGKQILNTDSQTGGKSGLDKESLTMWSYGKMETLNLFIPRLMGGASQEEGSEKMMMDVQQIVQENARSQEEVNHLAKGLGSLTYWGDQPGTSGPAYQGAVVVFLALLGFFFAWPKYRWWILSASVLTLLLAWGSNFMPLTDLFIDFAPLYNKFRAPSSILVVVELLFPLIAIVGLYRFFCDKALTQEYKQKILFRVSGAVVALTLLLLFFGKSLLGFSTATERQYLPDYLLDYLIGERAAMFRTDAVKAIVYVLIVAAVLYFGMKKKLSQNLALAIIGLVSIFDLWTVNKRYLNDDNFVDKTFAQNPFITEATDRLVTKAGGNDYIDGLISQAPVNAILEEISNNDKSHYRIFNTVLGPFSETNTSYFASSVGGYHAAKLRRYDDLINHYFSQGADPKILNLLNTKYVVTQDEEGNLQSMINPEANGNAWFVSDVQFAETPNDEIDALSKIDNKKTAVVAAEDRPYFSGKPLQSDPAATIQLTKYEPNTLTYSTRSATPQLAVFSEVYYPHGWKMLVDGKEVPYIKADYLLRAVHVPAGKHEVKMVFAPQVIEKGKTVSYAGLGVFVVLIALGYFVFERKKAEKKPAE
ncbi:MAG: hypothetical protein EAS48_08020 [Chryseobacterium sp.]|nr:MAG: hypothetical protein EAS48_08020 [Chryseobacterium sp.]